MGSGYRRPKTLKSLRTKANFGPYNFVLIGKNFGPYIGHAKIVPQALHINGTNWLVFRLLLGAFLFKNLEF